MGIQESPPRSKSRRVRISPAWWITLGAVVAAVWMWVDRGADPRPTATDPGSAVAELAPTAERSGIAGPGQARELAALELKLQEAQRDLEAQRWEIEDLEAKLASAEADSQAHRRGLEQAVAELNRLSEELQRLRTEVRRQPTSPLPPVPSAKVRPLGAPLVTTHLGGSVMVSGMVTNPTDYPARGTLEISLVGSTGVIDSRGFPMTLSPGGTERYDVPFTNIFPAERLGAKARWVE